MSRADVHTSSPDVRSRWAELPSFSRATAILAMIIACLAIIGRIFRITTFISILPGLVPMNPVTAVCFISAALSLWLLLEEPRRHSLIVTARVLACGVATVGALRITASLSAFDLHIDQILFREKLPFVAFGPNRMAPTTATAFVLIGTGLLVCDSKPLVYRAAFQFCALSVAAIALFAITAYAYETFSFSTSESPTPMALHTAVTFLLLTAGMLSKSRLNPAIDAGGSIGAMVANGFSAILAVMAAVGIIAFQNTTEAISDARRVTQLTKLIETLRELFSVFQDGEGGSQGYIISGDEVFLKQEQSAAARIPGVLDTSIALASDNPVQQSRLSALKLAIDDRMAHADRYVALRQSEGPDAGTSAFRTAGGRRSRDQVRGMIAIMMTEAVQARTDHENRAIARNARTLMTVVAGSVLGIACVSVSSLLIVRNINHRRKAEQRIVSLNRELEARNVSLDMLNKELEAFSYSVSHDLRSPLRSIDGFSQVLLEDFSSELNNEGLNHLTRIRKATQRMGQLIDGLLNLSHVTRSGMRRESVDLSAIAISILDDLRHREPGRDVTAAITPGVAASADPHLLRIVMENLLGNAWKFSGKQPAPRIEFGSVRENGDITYYVRDNGVGFDMNHAGKLFGAFQRLHAMTDFPGSGVGLATVQRIIHRHGGKIWAEGKVGTGATFHFTIGPKPNCPEQTDGHGSSELRITNSHGMTL